MNFNSSKARSLQTLLSSVRRTNIRYVSGDTIQNQTHAAGLRRTLNGRVGGASQSLFGNVDFCGDDLSTAVKTATSIRELNELTREQADSLSIRSATFALKRFVSLLKDSKRHEHFNQLPDGLETSDYINTANIKALVDVIENKNHNLIPLDAVKTFQALLSLEQKLADSFIEKHEDKIVTGILNDVDVYSIVSILSVCAETRSSLPHDVIKALESRVANFLPSLNAKSIAVIVSGLFRLVFQNYRINDETFRILDTAIVSNFSEFHDRSILRIFCSLVNMDYRVSTDLAELFSRAVNSSLLNLYDFDVIQTICALSRQSDVVIFQSTLDDVVIRISHNMSRIPFGRVRMFLQALQKLDLDIPSTFYVAVDKKMETQYQDSAFASILTCIRTLSRLGYSTSEAAWDNVFHTIRTGRTALDRSTIASLMQCVGYEKPVVPEDIRRILVAAVYENLADMESENLDNCLGGLLAMNETPSSEFVNSIQSLLVKDFFRLPWRRLAFLYKGLTTSGFPITSEHHETIMAKVTKKAEKLTYENTVRALWLVRYQPSIYNSKPEYLKLLESSLLSYAGKYRGDVWLAFGSLAWTDYAVSEKLCDAFESWILSDCTQITYQALGPICRALVSFNREVSNDVYDTLTNEFIQRAPANVDIRSFANFAKFFCKLKGDMPDEVKSIVFKRVTENIDKIDAARALGFVTSFKKWNLDVSEDNWKKLEMKIIETFRKNAFMDCVDILRQMSLLGYAPSPDCCAVLIDSFDRSMSLMKPIHLASSLSNLSEIGCPISKDKLEYADKMFCKEFHLLKDDRIGAVLKIFEKFDYVPSQEFGDHVLNRMRQPPTDDTMSTEASVSVKTIEDKFI